MKQTSEFEPRDPNSHRVRMSAPNTSLVLPTTPTLSDFVSQSFGEVRVSQRVSDSAERVELKHRTHKHPLLSLLCKSNTRQIRPLAQQYRCEYLSGYLNPRSKRAQSAQTRFDDFFPVSLPDPPDPFEYAHFWQQS